MCSAGHPIPTAALCCARRFVSDQAPGGMAALCQHRLLGALQQTQQAPGSERTHPPTQLEWTAGWRQGRMVLDVFTFTGDACLLSGLPRPTPQPARHSRPPSTPFPPQPSPCDPDLPALLLSEPPRDSIPFPSGWTLLSLTLAPTPRPCRGVLLGRGGVLDHRGATGRADSAEQVCGAWDGRAQPTLAIVLSASWFSSCSQPALPPSTSCGCSKAKTCSPGGGMGARGRGRWAGSRQ